MLKWYKRNHRVLPWRKNKNPYRVWISEVMLQQTRVETVVPYFERWMRRFPDIKALADATEDDVLIIWEGLGYYRRAHNLLKSARIIQREYSGKFPVDFKCFRSLPGLGAYSSAAIASIAFNQDLPVIEGNIRRLYSRLYDISAPINSSRFETRIRNLAEKNVPHGRAGDFNQALMDFGATICLPRQPRCQLCPLKDKCLAFQRGVQSLRPQVVQSKPIPHKRQSAAIIIWMQKKISKVLLKKRKSTGLLAGLWEFPIFRVAKNTSKDLSKNIYSTFRLKVRMGRPFTTIKHNYTHFRQTISAYSFLYIKGNIARDFKWVRVSNLSRYPMGKVNRLIADQWVSIQNER